jgi:hypothetical protein
MTVVLCWRFFKKRKRFLGESGSFGDFLFSWIRCGGEAHPDVMKPAVNSLHGATPFSQVFAEDILLIGILKYNDAVSWGADEGLEHIRFCLS